MNTLIDWRRWGADNHGVEVMEKIPPTQLRLHHGALRDLGIYLLEALNLETLAADRGYKSFVVVVSPLRLVAGTGRPVNPTAIA